MKNTLLQTFQWYSTNDGSFWNKLAQQAENIHALGYTMAWLPPAYKGHSGANDVGYGVYDLYDLGEFNAKGSVKTKYGSREEYLQALESLRKNDVKIISDIVLNHRMGADETETVMVQRVNGENREERQGEPYQTQVWSKFTFPERNNKYSAFQWNSTCFTGTDYDAGNQQNSLMLFDGKDWDQNVSQEQGNFDFIMGDDVDMNAGYVIKELYDWGKWYQETTGSDGYRLDAIKSIDSSFFENWLRMMGQHGKEEHPFAVGEYWSGNIDELQKYLNDCHHCMHLFDVALHYHFQQCADSSDNYDVRGIFGDTLTEREPEYSVPFVDNHDTQPGQALQSWVAEWFKPCAYASILLYKSEYPCVFIGDVEGIDNNGTSGVPNIHKMVWIRKNLLGDNICDLFDDDPKKASWISLSDHPVMVLYSIGGDKEKDVTFPELAGKRMVNILNQDHVESMDENGHGVFHVGDRQCAVFIPQEDYLKMKEQILDPEEKRAQHASDPQQNPDDAKPEAEAEPEDVRNPEASEQEADTPQSADSSESPRTQQEMDEEMQTVRDQTDISLNSLSN